jgi:hypothetical protein
MPLWGIELTLLTRTVHVYDKMQFHVVLNYLYPLLFQLISFNFHLFYFLNLIDLAVILNVFVQCM